MFHRVFLLVLHFLMTMQSIYFREKVLLFDLTELKQNSDVYIDVLDS